MEPIILTELKTHKGGGNYSYNTLTGFFTFSGPIPLVAQSKFGTSSRLIARTTEAIQFLTPTILRGTLAQVMPMTLHGRVTNNAIFDVLPDLLSPSFTLNVDGSFDNHTSMEMAHDLFLTGAGIFTNYAELKTKRFVASAMVANRNLIAATDIQVDSPAFSNSEG